jgi:hypothetical protein
MHNYTPARSPKRRPHRRLSSADRNADHSVAPEPVKRRSPG